MNPLSFHGKVKKKDSFNLEWYHRIRGKQLDLDDMLLCGIIQGCIIVCKHLKEKTKKIPKGKIKT